MTGSVAPAPRAAPRVLVVTVVHDPEDARIRHRQLTALLADGFAVTYAAPFEAYGRRPPVGVEAIDLPRAVGRHRWRSLAAARRLLRERGPDHDLVLVHDPELLLALPHRAGTGTAGRLVLVWDVHEDTAAALSMKAWLPAPLRRLLPAAVRATERVAERHVRLTLAEHEYASRFRRQHPVVPNSVLVPATEPLPPGPDRVVYLGRVTRARGGADLVDLGRLLRGRVVVEVVGPADADVRALLEDAHREGVVRWRGFIPNDEALRGLEGALAGLSLLHDEANYAHSRPTKVMEYMAHGLPVVTSPTRAAAELVERSGCGIVVPFADPGAAARAILELQEDGSRRRDMAAAGRRTATAELDWRLDGRRFAAQLREWVSTAG